MKIGEFGYPSDEVGKVGYYDKDGNRLFVITCKKNSSEYYFLYETQPDGTLKKIDKSKDPAILAARNHVEEKMRGEEHVDVHRGQQAKRVRRATQKARQ